MTIVTNPCATDQQNEWPSYDSEHGSDITVVAGGTVTARTAGGCEGGAWRFPAHRRVLAAAGGPLAALALNNDSVIYLHDVDKKAFDQVMRFLYGVPLQLTSAVVARSTLDAAHKFKLPALLDAAVDALAKILGADTVLVVFRDLRLYCGSNAAGAGVEHLRPVEPSAPPLSALKDVPPNPPLNHAAEQAIETQMISACARLLQLTLKAVDEHADSVLCDERFSELSYGDTALIALRPGLCVSSEALLAVALRSWAAAAVRRSGRVDVPQHRRTALGELCYAPRYLLLSEKEFLEEVAPLEILDPTETALVLAALCGRPLTECTPEQQSLLQRLAETRPNGKVVAKANIDTNNNKKRRKKSKELVNGDKDGGCCQCFGEGLLRTLLCLFD